MASVDVASTDNASQQKHTQETAGEHEDAEHSTIRHSPSDPPVQNTMTKTVLARHSTRVFQQHLSVPMPVIEQCLQLAQHSPSSTNIQPWRMYFTGGARLEKLKSAMLEAVNSGVESTVAPIPDEFKRYRSEVGHALYGAEGYGIDRSDKEGTRKAMMRNYDFMGAPLVAVVGMPEDLAKASGANILSVGLYLQTLVLLLTERGLGTCMLVSTSGYAQVLRKELGIPENIAVLCTLSVGYEDDSQHVNKFKMSRDQWREHVQFIMDD